MISAKLDSLLASVREQQQHRERNARLAAMILSDSSDGRGKRGGSVLLPVFSRFLMFRPLFCCFPDSRAHLLLLVLLRVTGGGGGTGLACVFADDNIAVWKHVSLRER